MNKKSDREILADNMTMLLEITRMTKQKLAEKSGITSRYISQLLNGEKSATIDTVAKIASAFQIPTWELMLPTLPYDIAKNGTLDKLVDDFSHCGRAGREYIAEVASREARAGVQQSSAQ